MGAEAFQRESVITPQLSIFDALVVSPYIILLKKQRVLDRIHVLFVATRPPDGWILWLF